MLQRVKGWSLEIGEPKKPRAAKPKGPEDERFLEASKDTLALLEKSRLKNLKSFLFRKKIGAVAATLITPVLGYVDYWLLMLQAGSDDGLAGLSVAFLGGLYWWVTQPKRKYRDAYKEEMLPRIAKLFGDFTYKLKGDLPIERMTPSKIVPGHDRYRTEDCFYGEYKGVGIDFIEVRFQQKRRSKNRTYYVDVFKGLSILIDMKERNKFLGHTILDRNKSKLGEWFKQKSSKLKRARMVDPEFEKLFDAYTSDQVEARYLLDPVMIERFKSMYTEYEGKAMTVAYYDNKVLILIKSDYNHFEPADIHTPATDPASLLHMKHEIGEVLSIVDKLELYDADKLHAKQTKPLSQE